MYDGDRGGRAGRVGLANAPASTDRLLAASSAHDAVRASCDGTPLRSPAEMGRKYRVGDTGALVVGALRAAPARTTGSDAPADAKGETKVMPDAGGDEVEADGADASTNGAGRPCRAGLPVRAFMVRSKAGSGSQMLPRGPVNERAIDRPLPCRAGTPRRRVEPTIDVRDEPRPRLARPRPSVKDDQWTRVGVERRASCGRAPDAGAREGSEQRALGRRTRKPRETRAPAGGTRSRFGKTSSSSKQERMHSPG